MTSPIPHELRRMSEQLAEAELRLVPGSDCGQLMPRAMKRSTRRYRLEGMSIRSTPQASTDILAARWRLQGTAFPCRRSHPSLISAQVSGSYRCLDLARIRTVVVSCSPSVEISHFWEICCNFTPSFAGFWESHVSGYTGILGGECWRTSPPLWFS